MVAKMNKNRNRHHNNKQQGQEYYKIFLVGLSGSFTDDEILGYFKKKFPSTFKVKLPKTNGKGSGCGVLMIYNESEYQEIITQHLFFYKQRRFFTNPFLKDEDLDAYLEGIEKRRLFVSRIPRWLKDKDFKKLMKQFGRVDDAYKINERDTRKEFCIGFVMFREAESARKAVELERMELKEGNYLVLKPFKKKKNSRKRSNPKNKKIQSKEDFGKDQRHSDQTERYHNKRQNYTPRAGNQDFNLYGEVQYNNYHGYSQGYNQNNTSLVYQPQQQQQYYSGGNQRHYPLHHQHENYNHPKEDKVACYEEEDEDSFISCLSKNINEVDQRDLEFESSLPMKERIVLISHKMKNFGSHDLSNLRINQPITNKKRSKSKIASGRNQLKANGRRIHSRQGCNFYY